MRLLSELDGLTAADVVHRRLSVLPASTTAGELRAYFASSGSHRLAVLVDGERYAGSLEASSVPDTAADDAVVTGFADRQRIVRPEAPAGDARDVALAHASLRVPVVDGAGALVGVVAITRDRRGFCGT
jgi:CBS-domain-containing membrane protein